MKLIMVLFVNTKFCKQCTTEKWSIPTCAQILKVQGHVFKMSILSNGLGSNTLLAKINFIPALPHVLIDSYVKTISVKV